MNLFSPPARLTRLQVEITTACNLRCAGCQRTQGMAEGQWVNAHMPLERFARILDHAPPARALVLQGIGEPTLHPQLAEMCRLGAASGKFELVGFNTNALARDTAYFAELRRHGLSHVSVSVDSLVPALATAARAGTDCDRLRRAITELAALFDQRLTLSVVVSRANLGGLAELLGELARLGGRLVEIQPLMSYGPAGDALRLDGAGLEQLRGIIARQRALFPAMTVLPAPAVTPDGSRCRRPMHAAYVTVEGLLTPCCLTEDTRLFGGASLADHDFIALWHSDTVARWFNGYLDRLPDICRGCCYNAAGTDTPTAADAADALRHGLEQMAAGQADAAAPSFRQAVDGEVRVESLHQLGLQAQRRGNAAQALAFLQTAQTLRPSPRQGHNLAVVLSSLGRHDEAERLLTEIVAAAPDYAQAHRTLAVQRQQRGDRTGAAQALRVLLHRAIDTGNLALAESVLPELLALDEDGPLLQSANLARSVGWTVLAGRMLDTVLARRPQHLGVRLYHCMAQLPVCYATDADIAPVRQRYEALLRTLSVATEQAPAGQLIEAVPQVGGAKPFYLSYQGRNDRDLQALYGRAITRIMAAADGSLPPAPPLHGGRLRIGFVSSYFRFHSISKLFAGWIRRLDRRGFQVFAYDLRGGTPDAWAQAQLGACDGGVRRGPTDDVPWIGAIRNDRPHVLIYPELGMDPAAVRLACRRLAPVQCVGWGHPVTTGLPHMDYFLSSALMEPADGDAHYTEKLVRLPNLGIWYEPMPDDGEHLARSGLGLRPEAVVYVCCQSLYKYLPAYDLVLTRIAAVVPQAQFLFIGAAAAPRTQQFRQRLAAAFASAGLAFERHVVMTEPVPPTAFPGLLRLGDVYLDSMGWSGGNTTLEAAACGLPILTLPGPMMRSRHSAAILRMMDLPQYIAADEDAYVALAVALASPSARRDASVLVAERAGRLYRDDSAIRGLEGFLREAVARAGSAVD